MDALIAVLPSAIAFAISPIGIVEMILVLFSERARVNGIVFLIVVIVPTILLPLAGAKGYQAASDTAASTTSTTAGWILLGLGVLLLLLAASNWRRRRDRSTPEVFGRIDGMGPGAVAFLALGVTVFNPKNLTLLLATGQSLGAVDASATGLVVGVLLFALVATLPFLVVIGCRLFGGTGAEAQLDRWKASLLANNRAIMAVVLGVLGVVLAVKGIRGIF